MIITGAVNISQLLNVTPTLQCLAMNRNDIGDEGMAIISEALQHNKLLTKLWVSRCGLLVKGSSYSIRYSTVWHKNFTYDYSYYI